MPDTVYTLGFTKDAGQTVQMVTISDKLNKAKSAVGRIISKYNRDNPKLPRADKAHYIYQNWQKVDSDFIYPLGDDAFYIIHPADPLEVKKFIEIYGLNNESYLYQKAADPKLLNIIADEAGKAARKIYDESQEKGIIN